MAGIPMNIPIAITLFRIVLIPVFIVAYYFPEQYEQKHLVLTIIFFIAGISDWFDGYFARKLNQQSAFGAFLDPVADKLMVTIALILLVNSHPEALMVIPAVVIIGREIAISALREWMANIGATAEVKVQYIGKVKTFAQLWAIGFMLYEKDIGSFEPLTFGYYLLYFAAALTLWSMVTYIAAAWPALTKQD